MKTKTFNQTKSSVMKIAKEVFDNLALESKEENPKSGKFILRKRYLFCHGEVRLIAKSKNQGR